MHYDIHRYISEFESRQTCTTIHANILDGLTFGNAMGLFHPDTAGHPRCLDEDVLMAFAPVVA